MCVSPNVESPACSRGWPFPRHDAQGLERVENRLADGPPSPAVLTAADVMGYPSPIAMRRREHDSTERKGRTGSARL
jgi:hypothetical protein